MFWLPPALRYLITEIPDLIQSSKSNAEASDLWEMQPIHNVEVVLTCFGWLECRAETVHQTRVSSDTVVL